MTAIDVGPGTFDGANNWSAAYTIVPKDNPANDTGSITTVKLRFATNATGVEVATFAASVNNLTTNGTAAIGNVTSGSEQTFAGLNIAVNAGEYIGHVSVTGELEGDTTGGGIWYYAGDKIPCASTAFTPYANRKSAIYGTGATGATTGYIDVGTRFKLTARSYKDIATRFKTTVQAYKDIGTRFKAIVQGFSDTPTRFWLTAKAYKDIASRFKLEVRNYTDVASRFKLVQPSFTDVATRFEVNSEFSYKDIATRFQTIVQGFIDTPSRFKLIAQNYTDIPSRFKLTVQNYQDITSRFKLTAQSYTDIASRFRLSAQGFKDTATRFKVTVQAYSDTPSRFRIIAQNYSNIGTRFQLGLEGLPYQTALAQGHFVVEIRTSNGTLLAQLENVYNCGYEQIVNEVGRAWGSLKRDDPKWSHLAEGRLLVIRELHQRPKVFVIRGIKERRE